MSDQRPRLRAVRATVASAATLLLAGIGAVGVPVSAQAAVIDATTGQELLDAIDTANATPGLDTIRVPAGTLTLPGAPAPVTEDIELIGAGSGLSTIDFDGHNGLFNDSSFPAHILVQGVTMTHSQTPVLQSRAASMTLRDVHIVDVADGLYLVPTTGGGGAFLLEDVLIERAGDHSLRIRGAHDASVVLTRVAVVDPAAPTASLWS